MKPQENWKPQSYLDQLRPDPGWTVTLGLFATYSAEMFAVAATLLALIGKQNGRGSGSAAHVIDAVDQLRPHVRIMAQAGRISPPENLPKIAGIFDQFIVDMPFPELERSWHPKIALVRYTSPVRGDRWRLWMGSRNLTGSGDLEAGILIEGAPGKRSGAGKLPGVGDLGRRLADRACLVGVVPGDIQTELEALRWTAPAGTKLRQVELFAEDSPRVYGPPAGEIERLIVVSPFLCPIFLREAGAWGSDSTRRTLVSTEAAIRKVGADKRTKLVRFADLLVFDAPELLAPPEPGPVGDDKPDEAEIEPISLHAKFLVFQQPATTQLRIGSANATDRAWSGRNAEVMATLEIDATVMAGILDLCGRARRIDIPPIEHDAEAATTNKRFENCRKRISSDWAVRIEHEGDALALVADEPPSLPADYELDVRLATRSDRAPWPPGGVGCVLGLVPLHDQTGLVRFRLRGDGETIEWARALNVVPPFDEGRDHAAFGRHFGMPALAAWLRGKFQPDLDTVPGDDWDSTTQSRSRSRGSPDAGERITMEAILLAWARDPDGFERIDSRFRSLLDAVIKHGEIATPDERKRLHDLKSVWTLAQRRLGKRS